MSKFSDTAFASLTDAKKEFGEYSYHDKGAREIMDLDALVRELRKLSVEEATQSILDLSRKKDASLLVTELLEEVQDWDELFENDDISEML